MKWLLVPVFVLLSHGPLGAQLTVTAKAPRFVNMAATFQKSIESTVAAELQKNQGQIQDLVDQYLGKPRFLGAFAQALPLKSSLPEFWGESLSAAVFLGSEAGASVDTWDWSALSARMAALNQDSDEPWGAHLRPLGLNLSLALPDLAGAWGRLQNRLLLSGGYFPYTDSQYQGSFAEASAGVSAAWTPEGAARNWYGWKGFRGTLALRWQQTRVMVEVPLDPFFQVVNAELAPGVPFPVTLEIIPSFRGGLENGGWTFPLSVDTALGFGDLVTLTLGGCLVGTLGGNHLVVDGQAAVTLPEGNRGMITDANGVEYPGWLRISGSVEGKPSPTLTGLVTASLQVSLGTVLLHVPLAWEPSSNLALGVFLGMGL